MIMVALKVQMQSTFRLLLFHGTRDAIAPACYTAHRFGAAPESVYAGPIGRYTVRAVFAHSKTEYRCKNKTNLHRKSERRC